MIFGGLVDTGAEPGNPIGDITPNRPGLVTAGGVNGLTICGGNTGGINPVPWFTGRVTSTRVPEVWLPLAEILSFLLSLESKPITSFRASLPRSFYNYPGKNCHHYIHFQSISNSRP